MPLINLIQEQRTVVKKGEQQVLVLMLAAASIGIVAFLGTGLLLFRTASLRAEAGTLQEQYNELKPIQDQLESVKAQSGQLRPRIQTLSEARDRTEQWMRILGHLATNTPESITLTSVDAQQSDRTKPLEVTLRGLGTTQDSVGAFLLRVQTSTDLENTNLSFTKEILSQNSDRLEFEFVSNVTGTAERVTKDAEEDKA